MKIIKYHLTNLYTKLILPYLAIFLWDKWHKVYHLSILLILSYLNIYLLHSFGNLYDRTIRMFLYCTVANKNIFYTCLVRNFFVLFVCANL